jgi:hypothetical protein
VVDDRFGDLAAGLDQREHLLGKPRAECLFEAGYDLHPFERIEAELDDVLKEDGLKDQLRLKQRQSTKYLLVGAP